MDEKYDNNMYDDNDNGTHTYIVQRAATMMAMMMTRMTMIETRKHNLQEDEREKAM